MSLDYWNMKLSGGYVEYDGRMRYIERVHWSDDEEDEEERDYKYPEDTLPYISFELNSGECVSFEEFTIKFPDDQWFRTKGGKLARLERNMQRQYKIAPTADMFHIIGRAHLSEALESCDLGEYDAPESIWDWDKPNHLFSKHIALVPESKNQRSLMYHGTAVALMERGKDYLLLKPLIGALPRKVNAMWGSKFNEKVPAPEIEEVKKGSNLANEWTIALSWSNFLSMRSSDSMNLVYFHQNDEGLCIWAFGRTLNITSKDDSELLWADNMIDTDMRNDLRILWIQYTETAS